MRWKGNCTLVEVKERKMWEQKEKKNKTHRTQTMSQIAFDKMWTGQLYRCEHRMQFCLLSVERVCTLLLEKHIDLKYVCMSGTSEQQNEMGKKDETYIHTRWRTKIGWEEDTKRNEFLCKQEWKICTEQGKMGKEQTFLHSSYWFGGALIFFFLRGNKELSKRMNGNIGCSWCSFLTLFRWKMCLASVWNIPERERGTRTKTTQK